MADPDSNSRGMITRLEQNTSYDIQVRKHYFFKTSMTTPRLFGVV